MDLLLAVPNPPPSFADFVEQTVNFSLHEWQRKHLCPLLERCVSERGVKVAIHGPPQFGKSVVTSQRLPAYLLGCDPTHRVGLACYNETHATGFGEVVKDLILSPDYREVFPGTSVRKDAPAGRFSTDKRAALNDAQPSFLAMGLLSGFTGKGVDTLIVDDPYKSADEARSETINEKVWRWWTQTAGVRISEQTNVIVMFHRYHEDDFAGRLLSSGKFEYVRFPAIADANEDGSDPTGRQAGEILSPMRSREWLEEKETDDPLTFAGQFQGTPRPESGGLFRRDYFEIVGPEEVPRLTRWVRYWDLATGVKQTNDHTAGALVGADDNGRLYVVHIARFRKEWPDTRPEILRITQSDLEWANRDWNEGDGLEKARYQVGMEAIGMQLALVQDIQRNDLFLRVPLWPKKSKGDKKQEASTWAARGAASPIRLVRGDWDVDGFLRRTLAFDGLGLLPDDEQDAVSGAVEILYASKGGEVKRPKTYYPGTTDYYRQLANQLRS